MLQTTYLTGILYFDAVHKAWPDDKPISVRISATDWIGKNGIWNFIHDKQRNKKVHINNFAYNYMDAKEFYFSWEKKGRMVNGELIETCKFDYLDINHEFIRRQRRREMENEIDTVSGPPVDLINVKVDIVRPVSTT